MLCGKHLQGYMRGLDLLKDHHIRQINRQVILTWTCSCVVIGIPDLATDVVATPIVAMFPVVAEVPVVQ